METEHRIMYKKAEARVFCMFVNVGLWCNGTGVWGSLNNSQKREFQSSFIKSKFDLSYFGQTLISDATRESIVVNGIDLMSCLFYKYWEMMKKEWIDKRLLISRFAMMNFFLRNSIKL